jgi:hypothetical protein
MTEMAKETATPEHKEWWKSHSEEKMMTVMWERAVRLVAW